MKRYFDFYGPLERRYLFNSFLVVVAVVEVLIFVFTLIWQIDEGVLGGPVKVVPFPWKEYLLVAFAAPIALLLVFGFIIRGFEALSPEAPGDAAPGSSPSGGRRKAWRSFSLGAGLLLALLALWRGGEGLLAAAAAFFKALGLGGTYLLAAFLGVAGLYLTLRLYLSYRLQKRALELRYRQYLAERHGLVLPDDPSGPRHLLFPGEGGLPEQPRLPEEPRRPKDSPS